LSAPNAEAVEPLDLFDATLFGDPLPVKPLAPDELLPPFVPALLPA
jgi:hypothetical protein